MSTSPAPSDARYHVDILSIESRRLLGGGWVHVDVDADTAILNTPFGADRADVMLQFEDGTTREVTLTPQPSTRPYEYALAWSGDDPLVPASVPRSE